jgi:FeS assembly SUF system protein|tara:strand:+ start:50 stop:367 length:318 start_codon:yes stop_codon:yes gene_type:complete
MDKETKLLGENVIQTLCEIYDPEIPVNIYELGLIYDIQISKNWDVKILMTFTAPNCPVAESMPIEIKDKVLKIKKINSVNVEITWDPPWNKDMMSDEAKLELGFL